jgi:pimeloyl-ACP methyl ester carboxylesterase
MRKLNFLLIILILNCNIFLACTYKVSEDKIFYPLKEAKLNNIFEHKQIFITTPSNIEIECWHLEQKEAKINILLFCGNAGNIRCYIPFFNILGEQLKANIFTFNYRGFGCSLGTPTVNGILEDARTAIAYFYENRLDKELPVYLVGYSLGCSVVLNIAKNYQDRINGIILIAPFTSLFKVAELIKKRKFSRFLSPFIRLKLPKAVKSLDNLSLIKDIKCPVIFVHGLADKLIPYTMSKELWSNSPSELKEIILIEKAGHRLEEKFIESMITELKKYIIYENIKKTEENLKEIIRLALEIAVIEGSIPSYHLIKDKQNIVICIDNLQKNLLPKFERINFIPLTSQEIQEKADKEGDFLYLKFRRIEFKAGVVSVDLDNIWAVSQATRAKGGAYLSGGGFTLKIYKEEGRLFPQIISMWIS